MNQELKSRWKARLRKVPGFRIARFFYHLVRSTELRNTALMSLQPPAGLFQPHGTTSVDRYPEIFQLVRERLGDSEDLRILSFGCSTGEEVFTLRRYFPSANIIGIDINRFNIAICKRKLRRITDPKLNFKCAGSTAAEPDESFDAIFAMAVFRHGSLNTTPPPPRCDHRIRFEDFERSVTDFARCLKPGALLIIHNAMFRFSDTTIADRFEPILSEEIATEGPIFHRSNRLLPVPLNPGVIFRKTSSS